MEYIDKNRIENNRAELIGVIEDDLALSHQVYGESFYTFTLRVQRLSGTNDRIKVLISERLLPDGSFKAGSRVRITGQFRSYNHVGETGNRLILTVFVKDIKPETDEAGNPNQLYLNGYVCKEPVYRTTPFGREITDMLVAVNRTYNKSDYIPVIAWGRNARFARQLAVGDNVQVWGRIQSRTYQKHLSDTETVTKTAYEVSVNQMSAEGTKSEEQESPENSEQ